MNDDQFMKIMQRFDEIDRQFIEVRAEIQDEIRGVHNILDMHIGMLKSDELERQSLGVQVSRHDDWIERAATKIDVRYSRAA